MSDYDAIITGAGAGRCIVAGILAEAGWRVLLLERGKLLSNAEIGRDHLRNQRLSLYGHNVGPDVVGNPRVFVDTSGRERVVAPNDGAYSNNAATVGGGTRVYGGQAWRFLPDDFRMASKYGVPEGSFLADWPITYDELAPDYERAEWEIGVCGEHEGNRFQGPRSRPYPLPPIPPSANGRALRRGAGALGWSVFSPPQLINTVPYLGRAACVHCKYCVGFYCPSNAKNGTWNTLLPRALASGNCELVTGAMIERIDTDSQGNAVGVTYFAEENGSLRRVSVTAKHVVCASGAVETARLLLNSASGKHPDGLGNENDLVGRNLQGHYYAGAHGLMEESVYDGIGPGASTATCEFSHDNAGIIGGGMMDDDYIVLPFHFWRGHLAPGTPRWGMENKRYMRENYVRTIHAMGPIQEITSPTARVSIDSAVRDRFGIPVVRLSGATHPESVRTFDFMSERAEEWLRASGAVKTWRHQTGLSLSGGQHQAGTCRMGTDPQTSVTDKWGRVHAHDNLHIVDASLHVTNGGFNPVLTIMALAFRVSGNLAASS